MSDSDDDGLLQMALKEQAQRDLNYTKPSSQFKLAAEKNQWRSKTHYNGVTNSSFLPTNYSGADQITPITSGDSFHSLRRHSPASQFKEFNQQYKKKKLRSTVTVRSSSGSAATVVVGEVTEVGNDTFWPTVNAAGDKIVVLDMYTQWCGPCKIMAPKFQELAEKHLHVVFLKLDCNQENKPLAKELGIKVVPTFKVHQ